MTQNWQVVRLENCCELVKKTFKPSKTDIRNYIGLEHIEQQTLRLITIGSTNDIQSNKFESSDGQILFGKLRPYFRKVYRPKFRGVCSTDIWVIDTCGQNDQSFFFYFFADNRIIAEANRSSEGTRMPRAKWDYMKRLEFAIPQFKEQQSIAKILSDLDSKIDLNRRMNYTLEMIGQAVFKSWFVDYEFPDGDGRPYRSSGGEMSYSKDLETEIPAEWKVQELQDIAKIVDCLHIQKPTKADNDSYLLQVFNIAGYGLIDLTTKFHVSDADYRLWIKNVEVVEGDCIISNAGRVGAIGQIP